MKKRYPKYLLFGVLGVLTLLVAVFGERSLLDPHSSMSESLRPVRRPLVLHGIAGALALLLGPLQFSSRIRVRYPRVHRLAGRVYVIGIAAASPVGLYMAFVHLPKDLVVANVGLALSWFVTTVAAFLAIRRGNTDEHRRWMIRSYAITMSFIEVRAFGAIPGIGPLELQTVISLVLVLNLLGTDLALSWSRIFKRGAQRREQG